MTIKPITWKAEPMGHTLQDTLGKSGLLGIIQYDTRRMAEEVSS